LFKQQFFESIDQLEVDEQEKERIKALKQVIDAKEAEIEKLGADDNGN